MGYCPFQSEPLFNSSGTFVRVYQIQCPRNSACELWDNENNKCGANTTNSIVSAVNSIISTVQISTDDIKTEIINVKSSMDTNFDNIESSMDTNSNSIRSSIGTNSDSVKSSMDTNFDSIESSIGTNFDSVKSSMDTMTNSLHTYLNNFINYFRIVLGRESELDVNHSLILYLQDILGRHEEKAFSPNDKTILTLGNHMHSAHYHMNPHYCTDIPLENGWISAVSYRAITLIGEFHGNQDLDNNKLIYGRDFKIIDDEEKPPVLKSIENSPSWIDPVNIITWNQYIEGNY